MKTVKLDKLVPWKDIEDSFDHVCGIGSYQTQFLVEEIPRKAVLKLDNVCDTYTVCLNGHCLSQGDPVKNETDITEALIFGTNDLEIRVSSTIQNVVNIDYLIENEKKDDYQCYGLWGDARILFY